MYSDEYLKGWMKPSYDSPRTWSKQVKATWHGEARSCLVAWGGRATLLPSTAVCCQSSRFEMALCLGGKLSPREYL